MSEPAPPVAWSYSRLTSFETCPRRFYGESVAKKFPFQKSEAMLYGDRVHKTFEMFLKNGQKFPLDLKHLEPIAAQIAKAPGDKIVEQQICLTADYEVTDWFSKQAWLRVKSDLTQVDGARAVIWDWKTGRMSDDFTQLRLNAAVTFHLDQDITDITVAYLWIKHKKITKAKLVRDQALGVWNEILPRVARYQEAHRDMAFPARQNPFCKYCPDKDCPFWGTSR